MDISYRAGESIPVSDISTFIFCPRKLYLKKVMKLKEPLNPKIVIGQVYHEVLEEFYKHESKVVVSINAHDSPESIILKYKNTFYALLVKAITRRRNMIRKTNASSLYMFQEVWPILSVKAKQRSSVVIECMKKCNVCGYDLWQALNPKISAEVNVSSKNLNIHGRIDQLEYDRNAIAPIEVKSVNSPSDGVWDSHEAQISAYLMILKEKNPSINKGYIEYNDCRAEIYLSPEKESKICDIISKIKETLSLNSPPPISDNKNKCAKCGIAKQCFSIADI